MLVTRILNLTNEEKNTLIEAGTLLGTIRDRGDSFDILADDVRDLVHAINDVSSKCLFLHGELKATEAEE